MPRKNEGRQVLTAMGNLRAADIDRLLQGFIEPTR